MEEKATTVTVKLEQAEKEEIIRACIKRNEILHDYLKEQKLTDLFIKRCIAETDRNVQKNSYKDYTWFQNTKLVEFDEFFVWVYTPEGFDYWNVHSKVIFDRIQRNESTNH